MSDAEHDRSQMHGRAQIRWRVKALARARGITSAVQLGQRVRLNKNSANSMWNGSSLRIDLDTLARLCQVLACTPGDLLVYLGEQQEEG